MKRVRKAVIPAAGLGTRFLPATKAVPKEMLPIVDKPTIQYIVEEAVASGIETIILITGRGKAEIEDHFSKYRLSDALMAVYKLFWDDFAAWYLEIIKPGYQQPIDKTTFDATLVFFEKLLKVLHPFMPFITEELYHLARERKNSDSIMVAPMPESKPFNASVVADFEIVKELVSGIRTMRKEQNIAFKEELSLYMKEVDARAPESLLEVVKKLGNLSEIKALDNKVPGAASFMIKSSEYYIPHGKKVDHAEEILKLQGELEYACGFLDSVMKKLSNERFVSSAPQKVIEIEQKKKADAESKIRVLEERIAGLKN